MKKKKILITAAVALGMLVGAALFFKFRYDSMVRTINAQPIEEVDLSRVEDGVYPGEFGDFLVHVSLEVTVSDGRITDIDVTEQRGGPGHEAHETLDMILEAQSPLVDAVSGATGSSRCIMIAAYRALSSGVR
ncbi:MAG: hypothetical protein AVO35_13045 [Candidatus Aegiribacteria sp. MLS_C]|nr:MAG: hypothetical protein AVO35_13045 [Candidatus Aegiribacteria sp. MLS_C]